ncbi:(2Fe-2S)-binding protein [Novosphingobium sp. KCTC 2891]|uniref:(2Fe-2S)-binding protein n=1 Tax=Novosphingobium sp. KCTC 2891 TaxID=2989730 RepID=UPI0022215A30|nr:(2Fe-2S)-binding protein [Novosphingobium sp. KCTC 2891]MCW1382938.1 (2Fe-2S)-binding protein [Novosphingobium sp. KCTC 2891]
MIEVEFVLPDGTRQRAFGREGYSLMEVGVRAGIPGIRAECGGSCACATCHVIIDPAWTDRVGPPHAAEDQLLDLLDRAPGSRLACQVRLKKDLDGLLAFAPAAD